MKEILKYSHPLCYSVAYCEAQRFVYQAFRVKEDSQFIKNLVNQKDKKALDFMEEFYKTIVKEGRNSQKDVYSRNSLKMLPLSATGELESSSNGEMKEFEDLPIKRPKNKHHY